MIANPRIEAGPSLRFGVMCNGTVFQRWQTDALNDLARHGHQLVLLVVDARSTPETSRFRSLLKKKWSTFLFSFLENRVFKPDARRLCTLNIGTGGVKTLHCLVEQKGFSEHFTGADVDFIRNCKVDFILRFGFNIIRGDILTAARFGVWSFHHDDELKYRGGPAGFWEIFNRDPVNGAIMQQLTNKLDGGIILKKGYLKTVCHSYRGNLEQLLTVSSAWPAMVADKLARNRGADFPESKTVAPVFKVPGNWKMILFLGKLLLNKLRFYRDDFFCSEVWNVGMVRKPIHEIALGTGTLQQGDVTWLRGAGRDKYLADPSGFIENNQLHILAEEYNYKTGIAGISEITPVTGPIPVIDSVYHLSYPFVIELNGETYCLPESYQSNAITLFKRNAENGKFTPEKILVADVEAVDPTLFFYNGLWWLFFTVKQYSTTHLFIYYSDQLAGDYQPHAGNPVKIDVRSARPAGTPFIHNGRLYRPAQDCSVTYGGRVEVNEVLKLSSSEFDELPVGFVMPVAGSKYNKGLHTVSGVGGHTLIDGKYYRFNRHFFVRQLQSKLKIKGPGNV